ncbi:DUF1996 domain-containing protein [Nonomuraea sp. NPDC049309]|uniref:DUF1996 domain-containing protein n=1 Tax=Nonomuraea sp. NPDC049309 TaxID=3364350 RepID=UPI003724219D
MTRSRRMAAAVSALAVTATGLVSAAVIGVGPAVAAPCIPGQTGQSPQGRQTQQPGRDQPDGNQQGRNQQGRNEQGRNGRGFDRDFGRDFGRRGQAQQDQDQNQQQSRNRQVGRQGQDGQGFDQQAPQGGGVAVNPRSPDDENDGGPSLFSRRRGGKPTNSPSPTPSPTDNQGNPDNGNNNGNNGNGANNGNGNNDGSNNGDNGNTGDNTGNNGNPGDNGNNNGNGGNNGDNGNGGNNGNADPSQSPSPSPTAGDPCAGLGPFVQDFVDIRQVQPTRLDARFGRNGSRGSFVSRCGTNREGHNNPDNFIVAPGVQNGAHHLHDYVGNLSTDAFSTDESLAAADTTCRLGDQSTYFWPVIRDRRSDTNAGDPDGNVGQVLRPRSVELRFRGNPTSRVVAMPRFMRIITGDAKAATNGTANAHAAWTCTGFQNRITTDKYPLCPRGSLVVRILDFPSCWDGQNTDSADHRTHVVFPDQNGACPQGTRAIPQLRMTLTYAVPQGPSYALDAFPEQKHNPVTDHGDFVNVMPDRLMQNVVNCINRGRRC